MRIDFREIDGVVLVDLFGSFPIDRENLKAIETRFCEILSGRKKFILLLHDIELDEDVRVGMGSLMGWLSSAGFQFGLPGSGPFLHVVTENRYIRSAGSAIGSRILCFPTEREALAAINRRRLGCLAGILALLGLLNALGLVA